MPLFPSLSRSRNNRTPHYQYDDDFDMEYESGDQPHTPHTPTRRTIPPGSGPSQAREQDRGQWEEEMVDYPSRAASYAAPGPPQGPSFGAPPQGPPRQGFNPSMGAGYPGHHPTSPSTITEETHDELDSETRSDSSVPIVQRVDSRNHRREQYDRRPSRPVTEVPIPSQHYTGTDMQTPIEFRNAYPQQQPVFVNQSTIRSMHPDVVQGEQYRERARGRHEAHRREYARPPSTDRSDSPVEEYPPCVVVVDKGRHGKKDTYYVIPGGAPVIFENQNGEEITRVGDFSGRYKPQPPRPIIFEDKHGRELHRMGFDGEYDRSYGSRGYDRDDDRHRGRQYSGGHSREYRGNESDYYRDRSGYRSPQSRGSDVPNFVYIDPSNSSRSGSLPDVDRTPRSRSSPRMYQDPARTLTSPIIHLDQFTRQGSGGSARTSGSSRSRRR